MARFDGRHQDGGAITKLLSWRALAGGSTVLAVVLLSVALVTFTAPADPAYAGPPQSGEEQIGGLDLLGSELALLSTGGGVGSITVTKSVNWSGATQVTTQSFKICIKGPLYPYGDGNCKDFNTANGWVQTWTDLAPGSYTVSEKSTTPGSLSDWTVSGSGVTVTVEAGCVQDVGGLAAQCAPCPSVTITNARKVGNLRVIKSVNWNGEENINQTFAICVKGPSYPNGNETGACQNADYDGGTLLWNNIIPGIYTVTETGASPVALGGWSVAGSGAQVTVSSGSTVTKTITNTRYVGSLTVTKSVDWKGVTPDPAQSFNICIIGPAPATTESCKDFNATKGWLQTWTNLAPGNYTVSEKSTSPGSLSDWAVSGSGVTVKVEAGCSQAVGDLGAECVPCPSVTITNTRLLPGLQIEKKADADTVNAGEQIGFTIAVTSTGPGTANGVTLSDAVPAGGKWSITDNTTDCTIESGVLTCDFGDMAEHATKSVHIVSPTNTDMCGSVDNSATVHADNHADVSDEDSVTVNCGGLTVTKIVNWDGTTVSLLQSFKICIRGPSYPNGNEPGACQNASSSGGTLHWYDIIPGDYTISETNPSGGWLVQGSPANVTVPAGCGESGSTSTGLSQPEQCPAVTITNTRNTLGRLRVTKVVNWNGAPANHGQDFEICIQGDSYPAGNESGACQTLVNKPNGGVLNWTGLLPGVYSVTEKTPAPQGAWTVKTGHSPLSVPDDGSLATATITNTRRLPKLTLDKEVVGDGDAVDSVLTFTIRITNTGPTPLKVVPLTDVFTGPVKFLRSQPVRDAMVGNHVTWNDLVAKFGGSSLQPGHSFLVIVALKVTSTDDTFNLDNTAIVEGAKDIYDTPANRAYDTVPLRNRSTAVTLLYFNAEAAAQGIVLRWATQTESNNYGFYLLRSTSGRFEEAVLLPDFIPGTGYGGHNGASYTYTDRGVTHGQSYTYWLVDVDLNGKETVHPETAVGIAADGTEYIFLPVIANQNR